MVTVVYAMSTRKAARIDQDYSRLKQRATLGVLILDLPL